jgi:transposase
MPKPKRTSPPRPRPERNRTPRETQPGSRARADGVELRSYDIGALPLLENILDRMQLERLLLEHLPEDDPRTELPTVKTLLVLIANLLLAREPIYGVGEWAAHFPPQLLGLSEDDLPRLHDDRLGRSLDRMFDGIGPALVLAVVRHVVQEFTISLEELHNDSTTISFFGAYDQAGQESQQRGRPTHAITWGHSKARRPDLKQLLYILTITSDGNVPIAFSSASGNVADDRTHIATWDLLHQLVGHPDFLYVADCKLASAENMSYIAARKGRFVTVMPRGRAEDTSFRQRLRTASPAPTWTRLYALTDAAGGVQDELSISGDDHVHSEGYRLFWYHSLRKAGLDGLARTRSIQRATEALGELRDRLQGPRTRFRERVPVEQAVAKVLADAGAGSWLTVAIEETEEETFRQAAPGRPNKDTRYVKQTRPRYTLSWKLNLEAITEAEREDGVFPLLTNDREMTATQVLQAYKRQPMIEKRFSQFKTDFAVAPVYLKNVARIQGLLAAYFFALVAQTLLERELRRALIREGRKTLPLYPEDRPCSRPTTHRVIEVFSTIQRHEVRVGAGPAQVLVTELTETQTDIIRLLGLDPETYGRV